MQVHESTTSAFADTATVGRRTFEDEGARGSVEPTFPEGSPVATCDRGVRQDPLTALLAQAVRTMRAEAQRERATRWAGEQ